MCKSSNGKLVDEGVASSCTLVHNMSGRICGPCSGPSSASRFDRCIPNPLRLTQLYISARLLAFHKEAYECEPIRLFGNLPSRGSRDARSMVCLSRDLQPILLGHITGTLLHQSLLLGLRLSVVSYARASYSDSQPTVSDNGRVYTQCY